MKITALVPIAKQLFLWKGGAYAKDQTTRNKIRNKLVQKIFENNNQKCGLIGTLGHKFSSEDTYHDAKHTTPQAPELQKLLRTFDEKGINNVCMEVSSHALDQNRVGGIDYKCAVITNLTQDHLDYHILMENYFEAKAILFRGLKEGCYAVTFL